VGAVVLWVYPGCGCATIKYVILLLSSHAGYLKVVQLRQFEPLRIHMCYGLVVFYPPLYSADVIVIIDPV